MDNAAAQRGGRQHRGVAHSALPDATVIRNLMERIDSLENDVNRLQACLKEVAAGRPLQEPCSGNAQNLRDREILEFLGDNPWNPQLKRRSGFRTRLLSHRFAKSRRP
jgi:hypothetical protein